MTRYDALWRSLQSRPFIPNAVAWDAEHPWNSLQWRVKTLDTWLPARECAVLCGRQARKIVARVRENDKFTLLMAVDPKTRLITHEPKQFTIVSRSHG